MLGTTLIAHFAMGGIPPQMVDPRKQAAEKIWRRRPAPEGVPNFGELTVSLKRYPDTKPELAARQSRAQRVDHLDRAVTLAAGQVFGVEDGGSAAFGGLQDQGVPVGDLVARFDLKGGEDRLRGVDDDLPTQVVLNQLFDLCAGQRMRDSAAKIHAELLQNLRT